MNLNGRSGFTLVELVVSIVIIVILSMIGFISLTKYTAMSRDSARLSDIASMERVLSYYFQENGHYPTPDNGIDITYSGSTLWTQGEFGDEVHRAVRRLSEPPRDPLTGEHYTYSVTYNGQEYQIAGALEGGEALSASPFIAGAHADFTRSYVQGNYNGSILAKVINTDLHIFGVPSIITQTIESVDILDVVSNQQFVLNEYAAVVPSYHEYLDASPKVVDFAPPEPINIVLYQGPAEELAQASSLQTFNDNYTNLYTDIITPTDYGTPIIGEATYTTPIIESLASRLAANTSLSTIVGNDLQDAIDSRVYYELSGTLSGSSSCSVNHKTTLSEINGYTMATMSEGVGYRSVRVTDYQGNLVGAGGLGGGCYIYKLRNGGGSSNSVTSICSDIGWYAYSASNGSSYNQITIKWMSSCPLNSEGNCEYRLVDNESDTEVYQVIYTPDGTFLEANVLEDTLPDYLASEYTCNGTEGLFVSGEGPLTISNMSPSSSTVTISYTDGSGLKIGGSSVCGPSSYSMTRTIGAFSTITVTRCNQSLPQTYEMTSTTFPDFLYQATIQ